jgi:hypothetical protein
MSYAPKGNRLPVDPIARRNSDGRITRTIALNRHLIPMPPLVFPASSWQASMKMPQIVDAFGHPEYLALQWRIAQLLDKANALPELSELDVIRLHDLSDLLPIVVRKTSGGIAARWPATNLLPIFGNWPVFSDLQARFRVRDGRHEVYDAIGFLHASSAALDLIEARLGPKSRALVGLWTAARKQPPVGVNGDIPFDFRGGE